MDLSPSLPIVTENILKFKNKIANIAVVVVLVLVVVVVVVGHYLSKCDSVICSVILLYASMKLFAYLLAFFSDPLCTPPFVLK